MDYMREYEKWLASPALTPEEHAELESIRGDEKEIRLPGQHPHLYFRRQGRYRPDRHLREGGLLVR